MPVASIHFYRESKHFPRKLSQILPLFHWPNYSALLTIKRLYKHIFRQAFLPLIKSGFWQQAGSEEIFNTGNLKVSATVKYHSYILWFITLVTQKKPIHTH